MSDLEPGGEVEKACRTLRFCVKETGGTVNVVRVELHGIAQFACWWFILWSTIGIVIAIAAILGSRW